MSVDIARGLISARARTLLLAAAAFAVTATRSSAAKPGDAAGSRHAARFLLYYGRADQTAIRHYDLAVLDSEIEAEVPACRRPGGMLLGYLSLGEVHMGRDYAADLGREGLLLDPNPNWPDARFIDLRAAGWRDRVVDRIVPDILARGFDGIFFDTLDNAEFLETRRPDRFAGMVAGAAELVRAVRSRFPGVPLMVNRGYAVLPRIAGQFDMLLGESVRSTFDAETGVYRMVPEAGYLWQVQQMRQALGRDPRLRLFSLDYWNAEDRAGIARLYAAAQANGFVPYVGTFDLTRIVAAS